MKLVEALAALEIKGEVTIDIVKSSYRRLALKHHPDKGGNAKLFTSINQAYKILVNNIENANKVSASTASASEKKSSNRYATGGTVDQADWFKDFVDSVSPEYRRRAHGVYEKVVNENKPRKKKKTTLQELQEYASSMGMHFLSLSEIRGVYYIISISGISLKRQGNRFLGYDYATSILSLKKIAETRVL